MDKKKIVQSAREKIGAEKKDASTPAGGQKSLLGDVIGAVIGMVGEAANASPTSNLTSAETQSARSEGRGGKVSGRKPQSSAKPEGRVASVGRSVAEQLRGKK